MKENIPSTSSSEKSTASGQGHCGSDGEQNSGEPGNPDILVREEGDKEVSTVADSQEERRKTWLDQA
ncbi:hypothetical protein LO772_26925 [Yinghuangia sp. ASG 101]|uniref:hypothetical protein n=1 Tax=Yinghuangia sp. ASG 101 TaxID=2896848 RepID=UPI001E52861A|nr:hypothetical protein [Yinghuangia sp. ASG 101]UGQ10452.1 hypothetical protein LO772_26925 [Yinghuangia sp. ASG 101]